MSELSKGTPFCRRVHVGPQHPLLSRLRLVDETEGYLVKLQFETRPKLIQLCLLVGDLLVGVVSKADYVVLVGEGYDPLRIGLGDWEEMLQGSLDPQAQTSCEVVEDEMRVDLGHGLQFLVDIVTQDHVLEAEVESGPNRQMA